MFSSLAKYPEGHESLHTKLLPDYYNIVQPLVFNAVSLTSEKQTYKFSPDTVNILVYYVSGSHYVYYLHSNNEYYPSFYNHYNIEPVLGLQDEQ